MLWCMNIMPNKRCLTSVILAPEYYLLPGYNIGVMAVKEICFNLSKFYKQRTLKASLSDVIGC